MAQTIKRLPTRQETRVRSLGREDPLEKEMATHPNTLAWEIPWTEERDKLLSMGLQRVGHDWTTSLSYTSKKGVGYCGQDGVQYFGETESFTASYLCSITNKVTKYKLLTII